jgi:hypothetical protein
MRSMANRTACWAASRSPMRCGKRRRLADREINRQEDDPKEDKPHSHVNETDLRAITTDSDFST